MRMWQCSGGLSISMHSYFLPVRIASMSGISSGVFAEDCMKSVKRHDNKQPRQQLDTSTGVGLQLSHAVFGVRTKVSLVGWAQFFFQIWRWTQQGRTVPEWKTAGQAPPCWAKCYLHLDLWKAAPWAATEIQQDAPARRAAATMKRLAGLPGRL